MRIIRLLLLVALAGPLAASDQHEATTASAENSNKLRTIVTTDGEGDDRCSMVRFLLYANEWDVRGLIHSSSKHHWKGDENHPEKKWHDVVWLDEQLAAYEEVYPTLVMHDPGYPSPDHLKRQVFVGNIAYEGDMAKPTPGSDRIAEVLLEADPSPVWLQAWGGPNTIARALKSIEEEHPERMPEVTRKVRFYQIATQDTTTDDYILKHWPGIFLIRSTGAYAGIAYRWRQIMTPDEQAYFNKDWLRENILTGHGPLCADYAVRKDGTFRSEGDSPAFLHLINVGLRSLDDPRYGGWGGRFEWKDNEWRPALDDDSVTRTILRWAPAFQNDWASRADWCVKGYDQANHPPNVKLEHAADLTARPGETVNLSARNSTDPDGDALSYKWWQYTEPGSYRNQVELKNGNRSEAKFAVPEDVHKGDTVHFICEVTDNGSPPLTRYQRVVVEFVSE